MSWTSLLDPKYLESRGESGLQCGNCCARSALYSEAVHSLKYACPSSDILQCERYSASWKRLGKGTQLPPRLMDLRLPQATMPEELGRMIDKLTLLTRLDCSRIGYLPAVTLASLQASPSSPDNLPIFSSVEVLRVAVGKCSSVDWGIGIHMSCLCCAVRAIRVALACAHGSILMPSLCS